MGKIFNFDGPFLTFMSRAADLFWLNTLYIICCIPIVTIGAATTALYYVTLKMAKDEESYITKSYFKSFKDNFKQATIIWLILLLIIVIMVTDLFIVNGGSLANILNNESINTVVLVAVGIVALLVAFELTYVFAILAKFDNTVKNTIINSFLISIRHLPYTIGMILITAVPYVLIFLSPAAMLIILIMFSLVAYINSRFFNKIFVFYMPKEEEDPKELEEKVFHDEGTIGN